MSKKKKLFCSDSCKNDFDKSGQSYKSIILRIYFINIITYYCMPYTLTISNLFYFVIFVLVIFYYVIKLLWAKFFLSHYDPRLMTCIFGDISTSDFYLRWYIACSSMVLYILLYIVHDFVLVNFWFIFTGH